MTARTTGLAAAVLASVAVFGANASAQATAQGFAVDRFDPSERGSTWFSADSLDLRGHARPSVGIVADWAYRPLVIYNADGTSRAALLQNQVALHPGANLTLWNRLRIGMDIPVFVVDQGTAATVNGVRYAPNAGASIGDVRLAADVRLFGKYDDPFTLAAGLAVYLPSGSRAAFTGDGTLRVQPRMLAAGRIGSFFVYAARVGFDVRTLSESFGGTELGSEITFSAAAGVKCIADRLVIGPEIFGSTIVGSSDGAFSSGNTPLEVLLGAHYAFLPDWRVGAGVGPGITQGLGAPAVRSVLSIEWTPAPAIPRPDSDHDGIWDGDDACPTIPGVATGDPATNGCPPDRDHDGIPDGQDACPEVPGVKTDNPATNGCPPDGDGDGVPDAEDACPMIAGVHTGDPKTNGCPPDRDADGVPDAEDACPMVPGVKTGDPKTNGCPADRDADGVLDTEDACPEQPGPRDPDPKKNGCPAAFLEGTQIKIRDPFKFRFNSIELDPAGDPILEAVLAFLKAHPELKRVRVEGHTDDVGGVEFNRKLSDGRAASVRKWLVTHGIDGSRLTSHGFGQERPVDSNATEEGRRNNRRVEFHTDQE
jgi:outer membrane protein OmpA-like peptidoglycan-associated protein